MAKEPLTAYCLKTKTKNTPFEGKPEIKRIVKKDGTPGNFMAQGVDSQGNSMCAMLGEAKALQAIKDGVAKKAF